MRRWVVPAGLAVVVLGILLLRSAARRPEAATSPPALPGAAAPAAAPPHGAPGPAPGDPPAEAMFQHAPPVDTNRRTMLDYPVTWQKLEAYAAAVKAIRAAASRDPSLMARLREVQPGAGFAETAARLEQIGSLGPILERHGLKATDLVLMPQAMLVGRNAYALEQEGRPMPPEQQNPGATELFRSDLARADAIEKAYLADQKAIRGR